MWEVNGRVTQTALAIRDEDELEVAASVLDAALRRAKAEGMREAVLAMETYAVRSYAIAHVMASVAELERDARAAQSEEGEHGQT